MRIVNPLNQIAAMHADGNGFNFILRKLTAEKIFQVEFRHFALHGGNAEFSLTFHLINLVSQIGYQLGMIGFFQAMFFVGLPFGFFENFLAFFGLAPIPLN